MKVADYDDWLKLGESERESIVQSWDPYARENLGFPYVAAGRLAIASKKRIVDLAVGIYHGGVYVIHATVSAEDYPSCPPPLQETFEGFHVIWMPESPPPDPIMT